MDFAEGFASFRTLRSVQSPPLRFTRNRAFECGPLYGQAKGETLYFLSASV